MITIALDEQGDFENLKGELYSEPVFIGGIIYDDLGNRSDYENEKKRLKSFFKKICAEARDNAGNVVGAVYPADLHYEEKNGVSNNDKVRAVKQLFGKSIEEYLEKGTWNGTALYSRVRKGRYHIFVSMRSKYGKQKLLSPDISEAVRDNYAANLYVHMAESVVSRIMFHNPVINDPDLIRLELATRRVLIDNTSFKNAEYIKLGFRTEERDTPIDPSKNEYLLTNPVNYRTAIEREMLHFEKNSIKIDQISVKSIYYKAEKDNMDFLYMADLICSYLSFNKEGSEPSEWLDSFNKNSAAINSGVKNLIWGYDEADEYFEKAWLSVEKGEYYDALSYKYDGSKCRSKMKKFYCDNWYPKIPAAIKRNIDPVKLSEAILKYKKNLMSNSVDQKKMVSIYEELERMSESISFRDKKQESVLYELYDAGISTYTHIGKVRKAKECFEKAKSFAEYVPTEEYLMTRNRMVVFLLDSFEYKAALSIADDNVIYHEMLNDLKKMMYENEEYESLNHAKALSQRGQVYATMEDEQAERDFVSALKIMDKGTPDYLITESYLLHFYIMAGNKDKYEEYAKEYFGGTNDLLKQFNYIARNGAGDDPLFSMKFALYVYIRSLYVFYADSIPAKLIEKLKNIESSLVSINRCAEKQLGGHPWEIIYKYNALILNAKGDKKTAQKYLSALEEFAGSSSGIIKEICDAGICECKGEAYNGHHKLAYMYV